MKIKQAIIKVHAGGGWDGHVVFTAINPNDLEDKSTSSNYTDMANFCEKRGLIIDEEFTRLVYKHLVYSAEDRGLVIPLQHIEDNDVLGSAHKFLKKNFLAYTH